MGNSESGLQAEEVVDETKVAQLYVSRLESTMNYAEYPERICFRFFREVRRSLTVECFRGFRVTHNNMLNLSEFFKNRICILLLEAA